VLLCFLSSLFVRLIINYYCDKIDNKN